MCLDEKVSAITLVISVALSAVVWNKTSDVAIRSTLIAFQFVAFMQLAEALSWHSNKTSNIDLSNLSTRLAFVLNMLQPLALLGAVMYTTTDTKIRSVCIATGIVYVVTILSYRKNIDLSAPMFRDSSCKNLQYYWWDEMGYSKYVYFAVLVIACLLIRPLDYGAMILAYITIALVATRVLRIGCGTASVWCWFVAFFPILVLYRIK